jgi:hypothetical protein
VGAWCARVESQQVVAATPTLIYPLPLSCAPVAVLPSPWIPSPLPSLAQDNSLLRRGGPCAHITYGVATAINAGTAAYFLGEGITRNHPLTEAQRLRVYELYFTCLRGSHVGQVRGATAAPVIGRCFRSGRSWLF